MIGAKASDTRRISAVTSAEDIGFASKPMAINLSLIFRVFDNLTYRGLQHCHGGPWASHPARKRRSVSRH